MEAASKGNKNVNWDPIKLDPEWPFEVLSTKFALNAGPIALLVVDMQSSQMTIHRDSPLAVGYPQIVEYWNRRLNECVVPNIQRLISLNRKTVYTRNGNVTSTGDEVTKRLKAKLSRRTTITHRTSRDYQIDDRLSPRDEDLVVDKLTSGAFTASFLDHALRNMEIRSLVITGVLTDACVLGTARAAAELGYNSLICEDACATLTQRAHDEALLMHARMFGRVESTEAVLSELSLDESKLTERDAELLGNSSQGVGLLLKTGSQSQIE
jgi:nicotinamidase-related amidase